MSFRYHVPLPGPFYYSGRVGPKRWLPRSSNGGSVLFYFTMKWLVVYLTVTFLVAGLVLLFAPFYGLLWMVRRSLRNRRKCRLVVRRFPVQRPVPRPYGFVPVRRRVRPVPYDFVPAQRERPAVGGGPFGSDRRV